MEDKELSVANLSSIKENCVLSEKAKRNFLRMLSTMILKIIELVFKSCVHSMYNSICYVVIAVKIEKTGSLSLSLSLSFSVSLFRICVI